MTRDELIKLAVECGWRSFPKRYLWKGLLTIYVGMSDSGENQILCLWDRRESGYPAKHLGDCLLSDLRSINRPWIIGPFSGKFFSLKSQRFW